MRNLIRNKFFIFGMIVFLLIVIMVASAYNNDEINSVRNILSVPLNPIKKIVSFLKNQGEKTVDYFKDVKKIREENEELHRQIRALDRQKNKINELEKENSELRKLLNFKEQYVEYNPIGASIISANSGNWFNIFTVDRGATDAIIQDTPVITSEGLVGRVINVDLVSSDILSIIDLDSSIHARMSRTGDLLMVSGDLELSKQGLCRLDYIPQGVVVKVGDTIETSGLGGIYAKGTEIGEVIKVVYSKGQIDSYAIIEPSVDFKRMDEVLLLRKIQSQE